MLLFSLIIAPLLAGNMCCGSSSNEQITPQKKEKNTNKQMYKNRSNNSIKHNKTPSNSSIDENKFQSFAARDTVKPKDKIGENTYSPKKQSNINKLFNNIYPQLLKLTTHLQSVVTKKDNDTPVLSMDYYYKNYKKINELLNLIKKNWKSVLKQGNEKTKLWSAFNTYCEIYQKYFDKNHFDIEGSFINSADFEKGTDEFVQETLLALLSEIKTKYKIAKNDDTDNIPKEERKE